MNEDDDEADRGGAEATAARYEYADGTTGAIEVGGAPARVGGIRGRVAVFDLPSLFWTVAKAREGREKGPKGAALAALRHARDLAERLGCDRACFAHERRPYWREAASVQGVRCVPKRVEVEGKGGFDGWGQTAPLIPYKAGRPKKDPELVAELAALSAALSVSGFQVFVVEEGRPFDPDEPGGGQGSNGPRPTFFEADEVAASLAARLAAEGWAAVVVSNDHDLAQVLALPVAGADPLRVRLARVSSGDADRMVDRVDVARLYGVPPEKLADLLALAGDGDFKPYPGRDRGAARRAAGIGEAGAREVLAEFGSFEAAVAAALAGLGRADASPQLKRALALLTEGGQERAACAGLLARVRLDVPFTAEDLTAVLGEPGDWAGAEAALKDAAAVEGVLAASTVHSLSEEARVRAELLPRLEPLAGGDPEDAVYGRARVPVVLTRAEFFALAPLPAACRAGLVDDEPECVARVLALLAEGRLADVSGLGVLVGVVHANDARALDELAGIAGMISVSGAPGPLDQATARLVDELGAVPGFAAFAGYGRPLARVR